MSRWKVSWITGLGSSSYMYIDATTAANAVTQVETYLGVIQAGMIITIERLTRA